MPLEDALSLISRNFQEVQRGGGSGREAVYALLGQLADGSTLTVLQLDKVMEYLQVSNKLHRKIYQCVKSSIPSMALLDL